MQCCIFLVVKGQAKEKRCEPQQNAPIHFLWLLFLLERRAKKSQPNLTSYMLFLYEEEVRTLRVTPGCVCRDPVRTRRQEGGHWRGNERTSLVVPCLRICLPVQGIQVGSLVWEDPTCFQAIKPVCSNYWPASLKPVLLNKRSHRGEKPMHLN